MIIVIYEIRDGENEYESINYFRDKNISDYREGKITDLDLLNEQYCGIEASDRDSEDSDWYWLGGVRTVQVYSVQEITEEELDIVSRFI